MKRTTKLVSLLIALAMLLSMLPMAAFAADETVLYLKPNSNWLQANARFAVYFFNNGEQWVDMELVDSAENIYSVTVPDGFKDLIFCRMNPGTTDNNWNNKWNQSGDLKVPTDGTNLFAINAGEWDCGTNGVWSTYSVECSHSFDTRVFDATCTSEGFTLYTCILCSYNYTDNYTAMLDHYFGDDEICDGCGVAGNFSSIYFVNSKSWDSVYVYAWNDTGDNSWPGKPMTATGETVNGFDVYSITFSTQYDNVIFNNGSGSQTSDLAIMMGMYYDVASDGWYPTLEDIPAADPLATNYTLNGSFNDWGGQSFTRTEEGSSYACVDLYLDAQATYEFKIVANGTWLGCNASVTGDIVDYGFYAEEQANCSITTGAAGIYCFTVNMDTNTLSITYPVCDHNFADGVCTNCGAADPDFVPPTEECAHTFVDGFCTICGEADPDFVAPDPEPVDRVTIYFQNNWMWSNICVYYWGSTEECAEWPGVSMEFVEGYEGYEYYAAQIPVDIDGFLINGVKNDGSEALDKTPDITVDWYDGVCYYMMWDEGNQVGSDVISNLLPSLCDHMLTYVDNGDGTHREECCSCLKVTQESLPHNFVDGVCDKCNVNENGDLVDVKPTVLFQNNWMWSDICIYYWGSDVETPEWPGVSMYYYDYICTYDYYSYNLPAGVEGFIINGVKNDGSGERDQTPDITEGWYNHICYYMIWEDGNQVGSDHLDNVIVCSHSYDDNCDSDCNLCGEYRNAPHNLTYVEGSVPANCQEEGWDEYWLCTTCKGCFGDAEASWQVNPAWLYYTGDHVRPEGAIPCAVVACEICGEDDYGESCDRGDAPVCQDASCINCGEIVWGWGCNYNTGDEETPLPLCQPGICVYCGTEYEKLYDCENGSWAPCTYDGECAYGCGKQFPATGEHEVDDPCTGGTCWLCWNEVEPTHSFVDGACEFCGEPDSGYVAPNPEKVENLYATDISTNSFILHWDETLYAVKYWVYIDGAPYASTTENTLTVTRRDASAEYTVAVIALLEDGTILSYELADQLTVYTNDIATDFYCESGYNSITVELNNNDATKAWVYIGTDADNLKPYASTTGASCTVTGLASNVEYFVSVVYLIDGKLVESTEIVSVTTKTTSALEVTLEDNTITWSEVEGSYKYWIYVDGQILCSTTETSYTFDMDVSDAVITVKGINPNGIYDYYPA